MGISLSTTVKTSILLDSQSSLRSCRSLSFNNSNLAASFLSSSPSTVFSLTSQQLSPVHLTSSHSSLSASETVTKTLLSSSQLTRSAKDGTITETGRPLAVVSSSSCLSFSRFLLTAPLRSALPLLEQLNKQQLHAKFQPR